MMKPQLGEGGGGGFRTLRAFLLIPTPEPWYSPRLSLWMPASMPDKPHDSVGGGIEPLFVHLY